MEIDLSRMLQIKDPDDLASFYGGVEFIELFCILPFMGNLLVRGAEFDDEGNVTTTGFPGQMKIAMVFSDASGFLCIYLGRAQIYSTMHDN